MKHWKVLAATLCISVLLCGCGKSNDVIVMVNDKPISQGEFDKNFEKRANSPELKRAGIDINAENNKPYYLILKNQVIDEMIVMSLIDEEVSKRNITVSDDEVNKEYSKLVESVGSEEQVKENLKQNDMTVSSFKKELKNELKYRKLIDQIAPVSVSDDDAKAFYNKNADKFNMPERVRASHILISANRDEIRSVLQSSKEGKGKPIETINTMVEKEMAKRLEKAQGILADVKKDQTKFAQIAKDKSDDRASAKQGGDLGIFTANQMVEPFSKAAFALKPNTVSDIVVTPYGYHIILVQDKMAAGKESFDKAKDHIKKMLEMEQRSKLVEDYLENIKKTAKIEYKDPSFKPEAITEEMKKFNVAAQSAGAPTAPKEEGKK